MCMHIIHTHSIYTYIMCIKQREKLSMKVIAVNNQKGGTGKTTTAAALGFALYHRGFKVLLIDLDSQGNLSYTVNAEGGRYGIFGAMERPETVQQEIQPACSDDKGGKIDIIPSTERLAVAEKIFTEIGKEYKLKEALQNIDSSAYDYVIIDTPPALSILSINALAAADTVIIPAQADIYSLQGITQISSTISTVRKYCNSKLSIDGIVLTRYNSRTTISKDLAAALAQTAEKLSTKVYDTRIRECTAIKEAQALRKDIFVYAPKSNAAEDYKSLTNEIVGG